MTTPENVSNTLVLLATLAAFAKFTFGEWARLEGWSARVALLLVCLGYLLWTCEYAALLVWKSKLLVDTWTEVACTGSLCAAGVVLLLRRKRLRTSMLAQLQHRRSVRTWTVVLIAFTIAAGFLVDYYIRQSLNEGQKVPALFESFDKGSMTPLLLAVYAAGLFRAFNLGRWNLVTIVPGLSAALYAAYVWPQWYGQEFGEHAYELTWLAFPVGYTLKVVVATTVWIYVHGVSRGRYAVEQVNVEEVYRRLSDKTEESPKKADYLAELIERRMSCAPVAVDELYEKTFVDGADKYMLIKDIREEVRGRLGGYAGSHSGSCGDASDRIGRWVDECGDQALLLSAALCCVEHISVIVNFQYRRLDLMVALPSTAAGLAFLVPARAGWYASDMFEFRRGLEIIERHLGWCRRAVFVDDEGMLVGMISLPSQVQVAAEPMRSTTRNPID